MFFCVYCPFVLLSNVLLYECAIVCWSVLLLMDMGLVYFWTIINLTAISSLVQVLFYERVFSLFLSQTPRSRIMYTFTKKSSKIFQKLLYILHPSQQCLRVPGPLQPHQHLVLSFPLFFSHSGGYIIVSHSFNLLFHDDEWYCILFLLLMGHLCSSFVKCMHKSLVNFFFDCDICLFIIGLSEFFI